MKVTAWVLSTTVVLSLASGCRTSDSAAPSKSAAAGAQPLFTPEPATLAQQKMCDEQARKKYLENRLSDFDAKSNQFTSSYTSHYDPTVNICYVRVHSLSADKKGSMVSDVVYDAFGGRVYATYIWLNSEGKKFWEVPPSECDVEIPGKPEEKCNSNTEFDELSEKYFGVTK